MHALPGGEPWSACLCLEHRHGDKDDENGCDDDDGAARGACGACGACGARCNLPSPVRHVAPAVALLSAPPQAEASQRLATQVLTTSNSSNSQFLATTRELFCFGQFPTLSNASSPNPFFADDSLCFGASPKKLVVPAAWSHDFPQIGPPEGFLPATSFSAELLSSPPWNWICSLAQSHGKKRCNMVQLPAKVS